MSQQALLMGIPWRPILVTAADFDGTNDYMLRGGGLTGAADSKSGILSTWIRLDGGDASTLRILGSSVTAGTAADRWRSSRLSTNKFLIAGTNAAGVAILQMISTTSYTAAATWLHFLVSWDLATAAAHLYVNGTADLAGGSTLTDDTLDYTVGDWGVGGDSNAGSKMNGCLTELYFAPGQFLDFSSATNRAKFRTSLGTPMYLGTDGALPTGTAPLVYQRMAAGAAVTTFATNRASGGDFTITGTLDLASTSPSD
mgnify:FL=1